MNVAKKHDIAYGLTLISTFTDEHSGKGLGNLIALPLSGTHIRTGNSCFYRTHSGSRKTLLWIATEYPDVEIQIFESKYARVTCSQLEH